ncbi:MAG: integrase core domain-containing protein [candidate division WOR-3 bacterium]|nr:integrase core domain-containing protein [candidate division WOR-3 bacterium]
MDPYEARDGIGHFIEYYNHRRPHQGIGFVTPYERLTGQDEHIKKVRRIRWKRKINSLYAQRIRMSKNKGLFLICPEETMSLISLNKNI